MTQSKKMQTRWPAEWETHQATWMAFPCRQQIWVNGLDKAQKAFANVANKISEFEPLKILVREAHLKNAGKLLSSDIEIIEAEIDDSWTRDTAPIWIEKNSQSVALDFEFNAWGNKFSPYDNDRKVAEFIATQSSSIRESFEMVLEGGSIHSNGAGLLLTTKECLLHQNRNPHMSQSQIESELTRTLGVEKFVWLENGVFGDVDTDGHIDNIACFTNANTVVSQKCDDNSENFSIYQTNREIIQEAELELVEIPEPKARYVDGERVPLSYINFYIANGALIVPKFGCAQDDSAQKILAELYSDRKICAIDANEILVGGGGIHCITMQQPKFPV